MNISDIIKKYSMELYSLDRTNFVSQLHRIPEDIKLVSVTQELLDENRLYCAKNYNSWKHNLKKGAKGLFVVYDGRVIGHGWLKFEGSKDPFYRFGKNVAYISELNVNKDFRGRGIAPAMMSNFIINYSDSYDFYISVYTTNNSSRNALLKVGFTYIEFFEFIRALKITWNQHKITRR